MLHIFIHKHVVLTECVPKKKDIGSKNLPYIIFFETILALISFDKNVFQNQSKKMERKFNKHDRKI